jgi:hypothetical protein
VTGKATRIYEMLPQCAPNEPATLELATASIDSRNIQRLRNGSNSELKPL